MAIDWDAEEARYWLTNKPSIAELRRLNRESPLLFPLPMLTTLIDAGVNISSESEAIVESFIHETESLIEMRWSVRMGDRLIAVLGEDGRDEFRVIAKRKTELPAPGCNVTK